MRIWQKILILLSIPILLEIVCVGFFASLIAWADGQSIQFEQTKNVLVRFSRAQLVLFRAIVELEKQKDDSSMGKEFGSMLHSIDDWESVTKKESNIRPELREAMAEDPEAFDHIREVVRKAQRVYTDPAISFNSKSDYIKRDFFALMLELKPLIGQMQTVDERLSSIGPGEIQTRWLLITLFAALMLILSTFFSYLIAVILFRDIVGRLDTIQQNAHRVAMGTELIPVPKSDNDEIADLDKAFHDAAEIIADARRKEFAILEKSVNVLFTLDRGLRIAAVGESAKRSWHYEPGDLRARSLLSMMPENYAGLAKNVFELTITADKEQQFDGQIKCGDGSVRDVHFNVAWQAESKVFHCVAHDITERREIERHKQELIAIAGSALDSPLSAVSVTLSGLATKHEDAMNDKMKSMLQRASGNLQRLTRLIGDLLDIEQMDSGKIVLNRDRVDAKAICVSAIDAVNALANRMGVKVVAPEETAELMADRRRVEQIMVNLISNAIKFSPKGEAVTIGIEKLQDVVELSVSDHGPGIEVSEQQLIFDRFYQAKTKSDAPIKSTGLGLTICKVLVEAHSGQIGVDGAPGKGSRFWIRLPAFEASGEEVSN